MTGQAGAAGAEVARSRPRTPAAALGDAGLAVAVATLWWATARQGGYHRAQFVPLIAGVGLAAGLSLAATRRVAVGRGWPPTRGPLVAAVVLVASAVASAVAGGSPASAVVTRVALIGGIGGGLVVGASTPPGRRRLVLRFVVGAATGVAATTWWGAVTRREPWGFLADGLWRGSSTLTYPNAAAALCGAMLLVELALLAGALGRPPTAAAGTEPRRVVDRFRPLVAFVLGVGLVASQSRAGLFAVAVGLGVLASRVGWRALLVAAGPVLAGLVPAAIGVWARSPLEQAAPASVPALGLVVGACIAVVGATLVERLPPASSSRRRGERWATSRSLARSRCLAGVAAFAGVAVVVLVSLSSAADGWADVAQSRLSVRSPVAGALPGSTASAPLGGDRAAAWRAAWDEVADRPVLGAGPERVELAWTGEDGAVYAGRYVHNEYLELAASQGLAGVAALALAVVLAWRWAGRAPPDAGESAALRAGVGAAVACFAVHSAFDYLWHVPVLPITVALLVGLAAAGTPLASPAGPTDRDPGSTGRSLDLVLRCAGVEEPRSQNAVAPLNAPGPRGTPRPSSRPDGRLPGPDASVNWPGAGMGISPMRGLPAVVE